MLSESSEVWYKILFGVDFGLLLFATIRVAGRLRSRPEATTNQTEHELRALRWIRPVLGLVFYGAVIDWLLPGTRLEFARLALPDLVRWTGEAIALAGILLVGWSFEVLGPHYRGGVGLWDDHDLVTFGPYRWIRHPIYAGFIWAMLGIAFLSADWVVGLSGLALTLSIPYLRVPIEERQLEERFEERYREYRARTGRFVPRL